MNRYIPLVFFFTVIISAVKGQDTLFLNNERLPVKVIKVSEQDITYKKWLDLGGREYTISKDEVYLIKYKNGEKDVFNEDVLFPSRLKKKAAFVGFEGLNYSKSDTLVLTWERIPVKVIRVSQEEITYKKWSNQDGPEYTIARKKVKFIKYKNGEKEVITEEDLPDKLTRNALFVGFGGLGYFLSCNYERKFGFTKKMNFFIVKGSASYFPNYFSSTDKYKGIVILASSITYNLKLDMGSSLEFGAGAGYYSLQPSYHYQYITPIFGLRREGNSGFLFKFYMSMLTLPQKPLKGNPEMFKGFDYYPFMGIDIGYAF